MIALAAVVVLGVVLIGLMLWVLRRIFRGQVSGEKP
jgi:hypothetical protein